MSTKKAKISPIVLLRQLVEQEIDFIGHHIAAIAGSKRRQLVSGLGPRLARCDRALGMLFSLEHKGETKITPGVRRFFKSWLKDHWAPVCPRIPMAENMQKILSASK
jgi:hypothetical protein